jgi:hypothetical protein
MAALIQRFVGLSPVGSHLEAPALKAPAKMGRSAEREVPAVIANRLVIPFVIALLAHQLSRPFGAKLWRAPIAADALAAPPFQHPEPPRGCKGQDH